MFTYTKTMDVRNLIKIEPLVVLYNNTDAVENGIEYSCDKPYSESENKRNMLLLQNVEKKLNTQKMNYQKNSKKRLYTKVNKSGDC